MFNKIMKKLFGLNQYAQLIIKNMVAVKNGVALTQVNVGWYAEKHNGVHVSVIENDKVVLGAGGAVTYGKIESVEIPNLTDPNKKTTVQGNLIVISKELIRTVPQEVWVAILEHEYHHASKNDFGFWAEFRADAHAVKTSGSLAVAKGLVRAYRFAAINTGLLWRGIDASIALLRLMSIGVFGLIYRK